MSAHHTGHSTAHRPHLCRKCYTRLQWHEDSQSYLCPYCQAEYTALEANRNRDAHERMCVLNRQVYATRLNGA